MGEGGDLEIFLTEELVGEIFFIFMNYSVTATANYMFRAAKTVSV